MRNSAVPRVRFCEGWPSYESFSHDPLKPDLLEDDYAEQYLTQLRQGRLQYQCDGGNDFYRKLGAELRSRGAIAPAVPSAEFSLDFSAVKIPPGRYLTGPELEAAVHSFLDELETA